jgi:hypothetical protein
VAPPFLVLAAAALLKTAASSRQGCHGCLLLLLLLQLVRCQLPLVLVLLVLRRLTCLNDSCGWFTCIPRLGPCQAVCQLK